MLSALWKWLFGGSLFLCIMLGIALKLERIHSHKLAQRNAELTELRAQDKANYENAQRTAKALNDAQIQRVEQQYKRNSDDERQAYLRDLARLRVERLRKQGSTAPQGAAGGSDPSQDRAPTSGTDGNGVQVPEPRNVQDEAAEIELRLMHLQNYVEQILGVDPNK
jgi:hypothetical protein